MTCLNCEIQLFPAATPWPILLNDDEESWASQLQRLLTPGGLESLVNDSADQGHAPFQGAEDTEDRARSLARYSEAVRRLGFHGMVRQVGALTCPVPLTAYAGNRPQIRLASSARSGILPSMPGLSAHQPLHLLLNYSRDAKQELLRFIKADSRKRGHNVRFDKNEVKPGDDWRHSIANGILRRNRVLSFLWKHSSRDSGVSRDASASRPEVFKNLSDEGFPKEDSWQPEARFAALTTMNACTTDPRYQGAGRV